MSDTLLIPLPQRAILRLQGAETRTLLQGLITANLRHLESGKALYSAMLSPQGKMLADFFLYDVGEDTILLDVDRPRAAELLAKLKIYKLRAKITMVDASEDWNIAALMETAAMTPIPKEVHCMPDPRNAIFGHGDLGFRLVAPASFALDDLARHLGARLGSFAEYDARRIELGLLDGSRDYIADRSLALEIGLDTMGAIDFAKGCYVGQEVTNRSKHRATLRKTIGKVEGPSLPVPGTLLMAGGKEAGEMRSSAGTTGLAILRIEEVSAAGSMVEAEGMKLQATLPEKSAE